MRNESLPQRPALKELLNDTREGNQCFKQVKSIYFGD